MHITVDVPVYFTLNSVTDELFISTDVAVISPHTDPRTNSVNYLTTNKYHDRKCSRKAITKNKSSYYKCIYLGFIHTISRQEILLKNIGTTRALEDTAMHRATVSGTYISIQHPDIKLNGMFSTRYEP